MVSTTNCNTSISHAHCPLTFSRVLGLSAVMAAVLVVVAVLSLVVGTADIGFADIFRIFSKNYSPEDPTRLILLRIRLPRILLAGLAGAGLSVGGVVFQAILRNPLADPFILGTSSGSAFGAILGILLGFSFLFGIPLMAFSGALLTIWLVMTLGKRKMGMESSTLLLTGVIINAFFTAIIMFFISTSADSRLHTMLFWLYGDLSQSQLSSLLIIAPLVIIAVMFLFSIAKELNILTSGEENAFQLGVNVDQIKRVALITVSLIMGLVVAFSGLIGFVGLIVPHLCRMAFGADHRQLLPVAALGGAIFLICADTLARILISPSELPVGVVTAFMGGPFFIYLLKKKGSQWDRS